MLYNTHPVSLAPSLPAPLQAAGLLQAGTGSSSTRGIVPWHCIGLSWRSGSCQGLSRGHSRAQEGGACTSMRQAFVGVISGNRPCHSKVIDAGQPRGVEE